MLLSFRDFQSSQEILLHVRIASIQVEDMVTGFQRVVQEQNKKKTPINRLLFWGFNIPKYSTTTIL